MADTSLARTSGAQLELYKSMVDEWQEYLIPLEDEQAFSNIMIYGRPGVGKSVTAGSDDRVLIIAPEDNGTVSAKRFGRSKAIKWKINTWDDIEGAYNKLYDLADSHGPLPFNWISIDSLTHMQRLAMRGILDKAVEKNPERDPDIPQLQEWQKYYEMFRRFVLAFNDIPVNVLYTAGVRTETDEEGNDYLVPDIKGKGTELSQDIASYMTSFGCMQVRRRKIQVDGQDKIEEYRRTTWRDLGKIQGKDRTGGLAPHTDITESDAGTALKRIRELIEAADARSKEASKVEAIDAEVVGVEENSTKMVEIEEEL